MKREQLVFGAMVCMFALLVFLLWQLAFMRLWLYHSQNRNLRPADYAVRLLTANEYEQLMDPNVREVDVADGPQTIVKIGEADWEARAKSRYKSAYNGKYYVEVTTKGAAHAMWYLYDIFVPAVIFSLGALLFLVAYHSVGKKREKAVET